MSTLSNGLVQFTASRLTNNHARTHARTHARRCFTQPYQLFSSVTGAMALQGRQCYRVDGITGRWCYRVDRVTGVMVLLSDGVTGLQG